MEERMAKWFQQKGVVEGRVRELEKDRFVKKRAAISLVGSKLKKRGSMMMGKKNSRFNMLLGKLTVKI